MIYVSALFADVEVIYRHLAGDRVSGLYLLQSEILR